MTEIGNSSAIKLTDEENYEDDFEPDISDNTSEKKEPVASNGNNLSNAESTGGIEKGQIEMENVKKDEQSDNESEADADAYNFTEDQKRAMMELMVQKQEDSDLLDEEPPEYNVKGRLEQLNAELANDPLPAEGEREAKVGFKPEIVDLVAPPPTFSDDESLPNSARGESEAQDSDKTAPSSDTNSSSPTYDKYDSDGKNQNQVVVEREGNFEVLPLNELTASERALYVSEDDKESKDDENHKRKEEENCQSSSSNNRNSTSSNINPKPPARPRPNTAAVSVRRNVRPAQSPRPKSANYSSGSNTSLDNFSYNSPYAMTTEQKDQARQMAKKSEEERSEREKRKQEEEEMKRKDNENAFRAWLKLKIDDDEQRRESQGKDKSNQDADKCPEVMPVADQSMKEENDEAYRNWLKEKRGQGKKDKLLKRRQQQEMMEGYYVRPREECEVAFREWLRKKNVALRQQHEIERQRSRLYRLQVKKSKKSQALVKAMKESQSFRYVDYYGYRF